MLLLPSYINVLTVYALSNLHDVSWGTKGDSKAEVLPTVEAIKQKDGTVAANVNVATNRAELSQHYREVLTELQSLPPPNSFAARERALAKKATTDPKQQQEDEYKAFRTILLLIYLGTNALLYILATTTLSGDLYINILLWAVAGLSAIKMLGVVFFITFRAFTDLLHCMDAGRKEFVKSYPNWSPNTDSSNPGVSGGMGRGGSAASLDLGSSESSSTIAMSSVRTDGVKGSGDFGYNSGAAAGFASSTTTNVYGTTTTTTTTTQYTSNQPSNAASAAAANIFGVQAQPPQPQSGGMRVVGRGPVAAVKMVGRNDTTVSNSSSILTADG
ncbi:Chitin synthase, class 1 [Quaeritorhiza haematococci]|nr:Chitin synthase, class 1 [Quaeritorhiza haematococci]